MIEEIPGNGSQKDVLPIARTEAILLQESGDEMLIYDLETDKAYNFNETASVIWKNCDGKTITKDLVAKYKLNEETIELAIDEFQKHGLLAEEIDTRVPKNRMARRKFMLRAGTMAMALPIVSVIVAPKAAYAQSCEPAGQIPPPPPSNQPSVSACIAYCGSRCCNGHGAGTQSNYNPQTQICNCITVICA